MFQPTATQEEITHLLMAAEEVGVSLHQIGVTPIWEVLPSPLHQGVLRSIDRSVRRAEATGTDCGCYTLADTYLRLSDGSLLRPDLMVFCAQPPLTRAALTVVPEAVVEILSPRGEFKDLQLGPPHYLANGVKDVLVVDPETEIATHFRREGTTPRRRGDTVLLECGCEITL